MRLIGQSPAKPSRTRRWKKPLSDKAKAEIKRVIASHQAASTDPFACINTDTEIKLVFPKWATP